MWDMAQWMQRFLEEMQAAFGDALAFVGLQGSRAREEATENSDIDVVVILDVLDARALKKYRSAIDRIEYREKLCGFISGKAELQNWEKSELFQFYHDTVPYYGDLKALLPNIELEDVRRATRIGACGIYHGCCHNILHDRDVKALQAFYKSATFVLRAEHFLKTGEYHAQLRALEEVLQDDGLDILHGCRAAGALREVGKEFDKLSELLMSWASKYILANGEMENRLSR